MEELELKAERAKIRMYHRTLKCHILTTRFNAKTWAESDTYRKSKLGGKGCAYGVPKPIAMNIPVGIDAFVLEMNNDLNRIMGIGKIRNCVAQRNGRIHDRGNYNLYIYTGNQRIDRCEMTPEEENVMMALDILCFRGSTHIKRGQGMITFPVRFQFRCLKIINLTDFFVKMFQRREPTVPFQTLPPYGEESYSVLSFERKGVAGGGTKVPPCPAPRI